MHDLIERTPSQVEDARPTYGYLPTARVVSRALVAEGGAPMNATRDLWHQIARSSMPVTWPNGLGHVTPIPSGETEKGNGIGATVCPSGGMSDTITTQ